MKLDLTRTYQKIARKLEQILQNQAPVNSGNLRNSIRVEFDENGFAIILGANAQYGFYLHTGTGDEKAAGTTSNFETTYMNLARNAYIENPGPGTGGIKPRYWLNFSDSVYEMINSEIEKAMAKELEKGITEVLNKAA